MAEDLKLFRSWSSRYALRVVQALKIKGLEYETILEDLKNKSDSLLEYNPVHKKVPVLLHNGRPICESLVILEYIDETWKQCPLLPQDPYEKAMARFWAKFGDDKVMPSIRSVFTSQGKEQEEAISEAKGNLKWLEEQLQGKRFFGGESIGYVDLAFGWMANLISILEEIADLKLVDAETFPQLSAWMNNFAEHPVIKEWWPPRDKMVEKFKAAREPYLSNAVLLHNGRPICESLVILEYIDETWKQCPLLPQDPYEKAMARFWAKFGDDKVLPSIWSVFISQGKEQEEAISEANGNLKWLEEQLQGKRFFGGESIGYVDLAFGWMANLISILEEIADLKVVDAETFPQLSAWMNNFAEHPVIKEWWPPRDKMVEKYKAIREPYLSNAASKTK